MGTLWFPFYFNCHPIQLVAINKTHLLFFYVFLYVRYIASVCHSQVLYGGEKVGYINCELIGGGLVF